ncbi:hypothetical protein CRP738_gp23 [Roseobacter phage CRP-738]|jgi:hypothetical protein|nr:hypothetical protein CRP738_gp23 [Roseobacter phage CRP-738]
MTFDEAVKKSIKQFMAGKLLTETAKLKEDGIFYSPEFFDDLEEELLNEDPDTEVEKELEDED